MKRPAGFGYWLAVSFCLALLQAGCLRPRPAEQEKPQYCQDVQRTLLTEAAASPTSIYLRFATRPARRNRARQKVMRIPLDAFPLHAGPATSSDSRIREVSDWFLPPEEGIPASAGRLLISSMDEDAKRIAQAREASNKVQVLALRHVFEHLGEAGDSGTISPKSLALADPVTAISLKRAAGTRMVLVIADVHEGCEHEKGWYALAPLEVGAEASLSSRLAAHLLLSGLWVE
jgi:hypothetical protein